MSLAQVIRKLVSLVVPPLVVAVPDGPREASWDAIRARVSRLPRLTYDGPELELVPELAAE